MTACGGPSTPSAVTDVSGTVVEDVTPDTEYSLKTGPWTGGAGNVVGYVGNSDTPQTLGSVAVNGAFTATLPTTFDASAFTNFTAFNFDSSCDANLKPSNSTTRIATLDLRVDADKDGKISPSLYSVSINNSNNTIDIRGSYGNLMYADQPVSVNGTQTCEGVIDALPITVKVNVSVNLVKGWNLIQEVVVLHGDGNKNEGSGTVTLTSGKLPTDKWVFIPQSGSLSINKNNLLQNIHADSNIFFR